MARRTSPKPRLPGTLDEHGSLIEAVDATAQQRSATLATHWMTARGDTSWKEPPDDGSSSKDHVQSVIAKANKADVHPRWCKRLFRATTTTLHSPDRSARHCRSGTISRADAVRC